MGILRTLLWVGAGVAGVLVLSWLAGRWRSRGRRPGPGDRGGNDRQGER